MIRALIFTVVGYLSGSVLYATVFSRLFGIENVAEQGKDKNPGTANAFMHGGFWVGVCTLVCDIGKGTLPVLLYTFGKTEAELASDIWLALVVAAPLLGHIFPIFNKFSGGKGVAVTFGVLIGLVPHAVPLFILAFYFVLFSVVLRVKTHYHRTVVTYYFTAATMFLLRVALPVSVGFLIITAAVQYKLHISTEKRQKFEVGLLWMH